MPIDINKLFDGIINPQPSQSVDQLSRPAASFAGQLGAIADAGQGNLKDSLRGSVGGLFGADLSTSRERLQTGLQGLNPNTQEGEQKIFELISQVDPAKAMEFRVMMSQQRREQQKANNQTRTSKASVVTANAASLRAKTDAAKLNKESPNKGRYLSAGGSIYDTQKGVWIADNGGGLGGLEHSPLEPDDYDRGSWVRYMRARNKATTEQEVNEAQLNLKPMNKDGWEWEKQPGQDDYGLDNYELMPKGKDRLAILVDVRAANRAGEVQRIKSENVLDVLAGMREGIESGNVATGLKGMVMRYVPSTDSYTFDADAETIASNLGLTALLEAKSTSSTGASGFGQLSEKEMVLLKTLIADMRIGMSKEDLLVRMARVEAAFTRARDEAKENWTIPEWLGYVEPPVGNQPVEPEPTPQEILNPQPQAAQYTQAEIAAEAARREKR